MLHPLPERVQRVLRHVTEEQRQVDRRGDVLGEERRALADLGAELCPVGVDGLGERGHQLVRKLGHVALDVHEEHLQQLRRLQPLGRGPLLELGDDRVDEGAKVVAHAPARPNRRATLEGARQRQRERGVGGGLVGGAVLDALLVVPLVLGRVLRAEPLELSARHFGRLVVVVEEPREEVRDDAHLRTRARVGGQLRKACWRCARGRHATSRTPPARTGPHPPSASSTAPPSARAAAGRRGCGRVRARPCS